MIMTPRNGLLTCSVDENIGEVSSRNSDHYSFIPVTDERGQFIGLFDAEPYFGTEPSSGNVRDNFTRLSESFLIGANASILDFIRDADQKPCRLVVSGHQIEGLVSSSDMQRLPVRAALFALITGFEITILDVIRKKFRGERDWLRHLSEGRRSLILSKIEKAKSEDAFVDALLFTQLSDKFDIIQNGFSLKRSKTKLSGEFSKIRKLRDAVAHANDYASSPEKAAGVSVIVRMLFELREEILDVVVE